MLKFNLEAVIPNILKKVAQEVKAEVDSLTPEDTLELVGNNQISEVSKQWDTQSIRIYNPTPYAVHVEYGARDGRKFGYHKPKGSLFYVGNGARMYGRTKEKMKDTIPQMIEEEIMQAIVKSKGF